jgi:hypothetical protein
MLRFGDGHRHLTRWAGVILLHGDAHALRERQHLSRGRAACADRLCNPHQWECKKENAK